MRGDRRQGVARLQRQPYSDSLELEGFDKDGFGDAELDAAAAIVAWGSGATACRAAGPSTATAPASARITISANGRRPFRHHHRPQRLARVRRPGRGGLCRIRERPLPAWALDGLPPLAAVSRRRPRRSDGRPRARSARSRAICPAAADRLDPLGPGKARRAEDPARDAPGFACDGLNGPLTKARSPRSRSRPVRGADVDGMIGPKTLAALEAA